MSANKKDELRTIRDNLHIGGGKRRRMVLPLDELDKLASTGTSQLQLIFEDGEIEFLRIPADITCIEIGPTTYDPSERKGAVKPPKLRLKKVK